MAPILKLTFAEKEEIEIQGKIYPIKLADSISLETNIVLESLQGKMVKAKAAVDAGKQPSSSEIAALAKMTRDLCKELIEAPKNITARLTDFQRMEILKAVFMAPVRAGATPAKTKKASSSSRRSKGSTAALRKTG